MFKLVIISIFVAIATAKPGYLAGEYNLRSRPEFFERVPIVKNALFSEKVPVINSAVISEPAHIEVKEPVVHKVGDIVRSVPTGITHHQSTVVHEKKISEPILAHGIKSYSIPTFRTYSAPVLSKEIRTYEVPVLSKEIKTHELPTISKEVKISEVPVFIKENKTHEAPVLSEIKTHEAPVLSEIKTHEASILGLGLHSHRLSGGLYGGSYDALYGGLHSDLYSGLRHSGLYSGLHNGLYSGLHNGLYSGLHSGLYGGLHGFERSPLLNDARFVSGLSYGGIPRFEKAL